MNERRIGEIVRKVYQEANESCVSDAKSALATYVEEDIFKNHKKSISSRTIERTFDKYIDGKKIGSPIAENVDLLCKFLGYKSYSDYVRSRRKWKLIITISIAFGAVLMTTLIFKNQPFKENSSSANDEPIDNIDDVNNTPSLTNTTIDKPIYPNYGENTCMTWADSLYITVSCDTGPYSKFGTKIKPLRPMMLQNMRKVKVHAAYKFFSEDGKPLIWYYKNKNGEHEYFTTLGFHPTTDETLKKITPYIIQTYVPKHLDNKESFVPE